MIYCQHESLFPGLATAGAASCRSRNNPSSHCRDVQHLGGHHQALSQTTTRERPRAAQSHSGSSCQKSRRAAGAIVASPASPPRCHSGRTLPTVGSRTRLAGEPSHHESGHRELELDAKKKTLRASEQDEIARAAWREQARALESEQLVFLDACGSHIAMTPLYARSPRGTRAVGKVPRNYGANMTLIASWSLQGMGEALILDGAADASAFAVYLEQRLAPSLKPEQIVMLDNLSIHQGTRVKKAIEARGCRWLFLPAYSPDFSPIEEAFSKLKTLLRRAGARTREGLQEVIAQALTLMTAQDASGWFTHGGYPPMSSELSSRKEEPMAQ